jgi:putrescine aminotransferase
MDLLTLADAIALDLCQSTRLFEQHINPGLLKAFRVLGFHSMDVASAEGMEIRLRDGRTLLDFSASIGVLALGHNHPRIIAAERLCHELKLVDALKVAPHRLQGALAYNLSQMLPTPLEVSFFTTSGAEAVEAGMKLSERVQGPARSKFITATGSYHGKTHGALALTQSGGFQDGYLLGLSKENVIPSPYGDADAIATALHRNRNSQGTSLIIALILEPIQGQGVIEPARGYLTEVSKLCRQHGVLLFFDEVKVGMGRTGTFCAFEEEGVVPDVLTLSKALGGGKRAIGAMITSRSLFKKAYGKMKHSALHTTTFGGLGETCAVAIETLNIFRDEQLVQGVKDKGDYLKSKLLRLKDRYNDQILEIRGRGLLQAIRFDFQKSKFSRLVDTSRFGFFRTFDSIMMACLIRQLHVEHGILTHFSTSDPDVLHIMPPLIVDRTHLDQFVNAIDSILSHGLFHLFFSYIKGRFPEVYS